MPRRLPPLNALPSFEAAARHLSFSRAAEELHLTQPAVSTQIRTLESHVGLALFEQLGKKVYLASALVRLAGLDEPPARFAAGADALQAFDAKADTLHAQAAAHRDLSASLALDAA